MKSVVIIGASHAGIACAEALRRSGYTDKIVLIDKLNGMPVQRPPLSKKFLLSEDTADGLPDDEYLLRKSDWYETNKITFLNGADVTDIDPDAKTVSLSSGNVYGYDHLVLATGATPRMLPKAAGLEGVHVLRSPNDAEVLRSAIKTSRRAVIIGGGYIGLEAAASLKKSGMKVDVIEVADRLLARVASPAISDFFQKLHQENDVNVHTGTSVEEISSSQDKFTGAILSNGAVIDADLLIVGIGVSPNVELGYRAGVDCQNGIVVGADMQTNINGIFAIGDVALSTSLAPQIEGTPIRVESVHNAQDSAARAVAAITGSDAPSWQSPWFWSEQYDIRLQSAGIVPPETDAVDYIIRPSKRPGGQSVWSYNGDQLCSVEAVRDAAGYMLGKKCLDAKKSPPIADIANPDFDLKAFLNV